MGCLLFAGDSRASREFQEVSEDFGGRFQSSMAERAQGQTGGVFAVRFDLAMMSLSSLMSEPMEITPQEVKLRLEAGEKLHLIDVREPHEYAQARIEGSELIPMRAVPAALQQLEARADDAPLIVYCHHGVRSLNVVNWLREQGIAGCQSMSGGIDAWSLAIDPAVPRY